jgi:deoxycytidylate deaminase
MKLDKFVNLAIDQAKLGDHKHRCGAIIFKGDRIISTGHNSILKSVRKLHPKFYHWPGSIHAEVAAISHARRNLKGMDILVVRINRVDKLMYAKPCVNCMKYIEYVGIDKVYYSTNDGIIEELVV